MPELKFRNLNVTPDDPVEQWGVEGLLTRDRPRITETLEAHHRNRHRQPPW